MIEELYLSEINIYPVKSLGGISLNTSLVEERGLQYDRRWMLIDNEGKFLSQREYPEMALFKLSFIGDGFSVLHTKSNNQNFIPFQPQTSEDVEVIIWNDKCVAKRVDYQLDKWFSKLLLTNCSLVYMPEEGERLVDKKYYSLDHLVSFADAYPFLIIGKASLDDLNSRLDNPVPMNRFRTNFVFSGGHPYFEDSWTDFQIGRVNFRAVKPCARCVITTTDQNTSERGNEPLATLSKYRNFNNKAMFGMNIISKSNGYVSVGDKITLKNHNNLGCL
jgi:uncharacterized protein YcbX